MLNFLTQWLLSAYARKVKRQTKVIDFTIASSEALLEKSKELDREATVKIQERASTQRTLDKLQDIFQ